MMNQGKPAVVKNPYAKASSSLSNARVPRPASSLNPTMKQPARVVPPKAVQHKPEQMKLNPISAPKKPPTEQRKTNIMEKKVSTADTKKNPPSLRMKLKKEIEDLKRQQQRQKERLEAERHRRKLEKQAERRKEQLEKQQTAEAALPTPGKSNDGGNARLHVTPSPGNAAQPSSPEASTEQSNPSNESKIYASSSSHQEIVTKDPPETPFVNPKSTEVSTHTSSLGRNAENTDSIAPEKDLCRNESMEHASHGLSNPTIEPSSNPSIASSSTKPTVPVLEDSRVSLPPASQASAPPQAVPPTFISTSEEIPQNALRVTNSVAQPPLAEGTAATRHNPYLLPSQEHGNPFVQVSALQPMASMLNPVSHMAPYMVPNPFAQPSSQMMPEVAAPFPNPYGFSSGYPVPSNHGFHMSWAPDPTWQQAVYNLQQQQYYYGNAYVATNPAARLGSNLPGAMNPWLMTMAAAYMGQALPQAQSVRRSTNRSSSNKKAQPNQHDLRLTSTPCRAPSPFARTHEILPHSIVIVKHGKDHKGFGVTLKKVAECALVGLDEWPTQEMFPTEKPKEKADKPEKTNASVSPVGKADEIMVNGIDGDKKVQATNTNCTITEPQNNEVIVQEMTETTKDSSVSLQENQHALLNANQLVIENRMDEVSSEPSKSIESSSSTDAPEASKGSPSLAPTENEVNVATLAVTSVAPDIVKSKQERQRKRRRLFFCVMQVLNAADQNQRSHSSKEPSMQLQEGDIILTIQGEETARKSFDDAVKLFAAANSAGEDGFIQCVVTVARRKKVAPAPMRLPKYIPSITKNSSSAPLTEPEFRALATTMIDVARNQQRVLGQSINRSLMDELFQCCPLFSSRAPDFLASSWEFISERIKREIRRRAIENWAAKWQSEKAEIKASTKSPITDAQRSSRRARPRPARGCRCGSQDHEYVNDIYCPLYSNLRRLKQESSSPEEVDPKSTRTKIKGPKDLNAVEKAFKDRFIRIKEEELALEAEATFVGEMESIQLQKCGMAIFAPGSLAAMVLSAAVELEPRFRSRKAVQPVEVKELEMVEKNATDDSDDDDNVPLTSLGKRSSKDASLPHHKKKKAEPQIPLDYLISLIGYVSSRWGHVYREPSELDYAWRWEVYHGQFSLADSSIVCKNPRRAGALSLENIPFLINTALVNELQQNEPLVNLPPDELNSIAFAVLPTATGIVDELYALVRSSILELNEAGIPKLAPHWFSNVDVLLLDDMDSYWGIRADPTGKFGMSQHVRATLHREWEKTDEGWILVVEDPYDVVYEFAVFDEWRDAFEDKEKIKADSIEGVGRFGI